MICVSKLWVLGKPKPVVVSPPIQQSAQENAAKNQWYYVFQKAQCVNSIIFTAFEV